MIPVMPTDEKLGRGLGTRIAVECLQIQWISWVGRSEEHRFVPWPGGDWQDSAVTLPQDLFCQTNMMWAGQPSTCARQMISLHTTAAKQYFLPGEHEPGEVKDF